MSIKKAVVAYDWNALIRTFGAIVWTQANVPSYARDLQTLSGLDGITKGQIGGTGEHCLWKTTNNATAFGVAMADRNAGSGKTLPPFYTGDGYQIDFWLHPGSTPTASDVTGFGLLFNRSNLGGPNYDQILAKFTYPATLAITRTLNGVVTTPVNNVGMVNIPGGGAGPFRFTFFKFLNTVYIGFMRPTFGAADFGVAQADNDFTPIMSWAQCHIPQVSNHPQEKPVPFCAFFNTAQATPNLRPAMSQCMEQNIFITPTEILPLFVSRPGGVGFAYNAALRFVTDIPAGGWDFQTYIINLAGAQASNGASVTPKVILVNNFSQNGSTYIYLGDRIYVVKPGGTISIPLNGEISVILKGEDYANISIIDGALADFYGV